LFAPLATLDRFGLDAHPRGPKFIAALARLPLRKFYVKFLDQQKV
jgi:hypothetical protein